MEVVYTKDVDNFEFNKSLVTVYGDILDLMEMGIDIEGVEYDDEWTGKRFLREYSLKAKMRLRSVLNYLNFDEKYLNEKIKNLSKVNFKYLMLAYLLIKNKNIIIFDHFDVGLAYNEQKRFVRLLNNLSGLDKKIIVISHDLVFLSQVSNELIVLDKGNIIYNGILNDIFKENYKELDEPEIIHFIKMANKRGAELSYTCDSKELLKDIYRSVC